MGIDCDNFSARKENDFSVLINVRDCTVAPQIRFHSFTLPANVQVEDLILQIANRSSVKPEHLYLSYVGPSASTEVCLNENQCSLIEALEGIVALQPDSKLNFMVTLNDDASSNLNKSKNDSDLSSIEFSPQHNSCDSPTSPIPALIDGNSWSGEPMLASSLPDDRTAQQSECSTSVTEVPAKRFVGLVNQAMTCYLNSLIQTLFMTPEFRNAIYAWDPSGLNDENSKARSIPYQLQRLFLRLQFSNRQAVETTSLTTSFGWDTSEAWEQHDVQELCRILFDALEAAWRDTDKSDFIDHLYQGKMEDYVQCLTCNNCSSRVAKYQDISLAIRSFDGQVSYATLHDALAAFTKPEILSDDNKYYCEKCAEKQDASKGLRFLSFPRVVTMQLKRFDFDYRFGNRVKLNDRLFFPNYINLDRYVANTPGTVDIKNGASFQECSSNGEEMSKPLECDDYDDGTAVCRYELLSVLVHSGSASGGHYYAYIKNLEDGLFYCFNDRNVRRVNDEEIRLTFGSGGGSSSAYSYSTSAYMLMYHLVDKSQSNFLTSAEMQSFPWLLKMIDEVNRSDAASEFSHNDRILSKANKYDDISMASTLAAPTYSAGNSDSDSMLHAAITVFYIHPDDCVATPSRVRLAPSTGLREAADIVVKELNLDRVLLETNVHYRLVPYNNYTKVFGIMEDDSAVDGNESVGDDCTTSPISQFCKNSNGTFFLEVLPADIPFRRFSRGCVTLVVNLIDPVEMRVSRCAMTAVPSSWSIGRIGSYITQMMSLPFPHVRMGIIERNWPSEDTIRHLVKTESTLEQEKLIDPPLDLYVENLSETEDRLYPFRRTLLYRFVDFQINATSLTVSVRFDRPNVPIVVLSETSAILTESSLVPITVCSSKLTLLDGSQRVDLPAPYSGSIDGYLIKCTFSKSEDESIVISVKADKRLVIADLAQALASHMGFDPCSTVIWRDFGSQSDEQLRPTLALEFISTSSRLNLRAGRVLNESQVVINVHQMEDAPKKLNQPAFDRFSVVLESEWPLSRLNQLIVSFLKQQYGIDCCVGSLSPNKVSSCLLCSGQSMYHLRLRKYRYGEVGRILVPTEVFGKDIEWNAIKDVFVELLTTGPEIKQAANDLVVLCKHWRPSALSLEKPIELCVSSRNGSELLTKLSSIFKIDPEKIEVASCSSATTQVSLLDMQDHVRWNLLSSIKEVDGYPLMLHEDCAQIYLRDNTEQMADIDEEKRRQIINNEANTRSVSNGNHRSSSSFHSSLSSALRERVGRPKEKSLKIYTHQSSPPPPASNVASIPVPPATSPTSSLSARSIDTATGVSENGSLMDTDKQHPAMTGLDVD